jgi:hypothetical protein
LGLARDCLNSRESKKVLISVCQSHGACSLFQAEKYILQSNTDHRCVEVLRPAFG